MAGTPFPFPKSSTPGARPGEGEGRYMNCYPSVEGDRTYIRRVSGLALLVNTAKTGIRGMLDVNGVKYIVYTGSVVTVSAGGIVTTLTGSITGSDGVTIERNNKVTAGVSTPDVVAVREGGGAYVLTSSAVSAYPDADLPTTVNSVAFLEGFFLFSIADGRLFASELNSTDINALSFATAEARSDGLLRIIVRGNLAYAMGSSTIEIWKNVGTSPFPLQRSPTVIPIGLRTTMAVAGYEESWDQPLFFVAADNTMKAMEGYQVASVTTDDLNRFLAASTPSTIRMMVYVDKGQAFVSVTSGAGTWNRNVAKASWVERDSAVSGSSIGKWRGICSVYSNGVWVFGDSESGKLFTLSSTLQEDGGALGGFFQSGPLKDFPRDIAAKVEADFTEADLDVFVSWSLNGGKTWSDELTRSLADTDKFPVSVANVGKSTHHGIIMKYRWEGAADFSFSGCAADRAEIRGG